MMGAMIRGLPMISALGGLAGGLYWTILPDWTIVPIGAPATKQNLEYFKTGKGIDAHTLELIKEVEDQLLLKDVNTDSLASVEHFWSRSPDVVPIGNVNQRKISFIGLPVNFIYRNIEEVRIASDRGDQESEHLKRSMLLGDSAKKFAMASAYYQLDSYQFVGKLILLTQAIGPYGTLSYLQPFTFNKSKLRQFSISVCVLFVWAVMFYYTSQMLKSYTIHSADRKAADLGEDFLEGGIEYFTKTLDRNRLVHHLDPTKGATMVDADGNQIFGRFEIPEPLFTSRREKLVKMAEKSKQSN